MIEILEVACAIMFTVAPGQKVYDRFKGIPIDTETNIWYINFSDDIEKRGYTFKYDTPAKLVNSNECIITKKRELHEQSK